MKITSTSIIRGAALLFTLMLAACGGGGGGSGGNSGSGIPAVSTYSIGGSVSGLVGSGLVLQNNAGDDLVVSANGTFAFVSKISSGSTYAVTVKTQPHSPGQICSVSNGSGTASTNVADITVTCSTNAYTVSGIVSGLSGSGLVLQNNNADDLPVSANGTFSFVTQVADGAGYSVAVKTQPGSPVQTCTVNGGSGTVAGAAVSGVTVTCSTNAYTVGGTVSGLTSKGLVLQNNAGDNLIVNANGTFTFATSVASGAGYSVSVKTQPSLPEQSCAVGSGSGTVSAANIGSVTVTCSDYVPRFAYVANFNDNTISSFTVNTTTGQLRHNGYVATGVGPLSITVDPTGKYVYEANLWGNTVYAYSINASTGELSFQSTVSTSGVQPRSITVHPSGKFAYVANEISGNIGQFSIANGILSPMTPATVAAGTGPYSIAIDPSGKFAYVANSTANSIWAYTIDATTGALTRVGGAAATGANPYTVTVDPSGKFVYAANFGDNTISAFTIDTATGALSSVSTVVAAGTNPYTVTVDPSGKFAYAANYTSGNVSAYSINATTGALTAVAGSPFAAGTSPNAVTVDPSGKFVYVANSGSNDVSTYSVNATTGVLTALPKTAGRNGSSVMALVRGTAAVSYTPKFAYTANYGSNNVSQYTINAAAGWLTSIGGDVAAGTGPESVAVSPSGKFAYVANFTSNDVSIFRVDAATGALSSIAQAGMPAFGGNPAIPAIAGSVAAGAGTFSVAVDPTGRYVYAANSTSNDISAYSVNATNGELTRILCGGGAGCNVDNFLAGTNPQAITVDPTGQFAYVANAGSNNVSAYLISHTTGALISLGTVAAGVTPQSITVDASGKYAYVANFDAIGGTKLVSQYSIGGNGVLTPMTPSTVASGGVPMAVAIDVLGRGVYVTNANSSISQYTIGATGGLNPMTAAVTVAGTPTALAVDPSGKFAYAVSSSANTITDYTMDATGALVLGVFRPGSSTPGLSGAATGTNPVSIAITGTIQ